MPLHSQAAAHFLDVWLSKTIISIILQDQYTEYIKTEDESLRTIRCSFTPRLGKTSQIKKSASEGMLSYFCDGD
jgi:hypothetical protein